MLRRPLEFTQYTSALFAQAAERAGVATSMGSVGEPHDNAVAEAFMASLKRELVSRRSWPTRRELRIAVYDYIETFYNRTRRHSALGYLSPATYEHLTDLSEPPSTDQNRP